MNLLDRYIIKQFLWNFILVLGGLLSLYLLIDFFEKIDNFTESGKTVSYALQFFMLKIPDIYFQISPVCSLLAGIVTLGVLNQNKESIALNAGGISFVRIIIPLVFASLIITLATMAMSQWLLPVTSTRANTIWDGEIRQKQTNGIIRNNNVFFHGKEGIYTFNYNRDHTVFKNFLYTSWDKKRQLTLYISAETAQFDEGWTLINGIKKNKTTAGDFAINIFDRLDINFNESPEDFFTPAFKPGEHSLTQLWRHAHDGSDQSTRLLQAFYSRISFIFLGMPLLLFAIPITTHIHNKWDRDLTVAVPFSCALAFVVWGIWSALQSMTKLSIVSPLIGAWSVHIIAFIIAILWIGRQNSHGA